VFIIRFTETLLEQEDEAAEASTIENIEHAEGPETVPTENQEHEESSDSNNVGNLQTDEEANEKVEDGGLDTLVDAIMTDHPILRSLESITFEICRGLPELFEPSQRKLKNICDGKGIKFVVKKWWQPWPPV
jgi:hypothetical protein